MELLCLKSTDKYLRITDNTFSLVTLKEATVFKVSEGNFVKKYLDSFKQELDHLIIAKLTISEEEYKV
jgi:hypothetical protein